MGVNDENNSKLTLSLFRDIFGDVYPNLVIDSFEVSGNFEMKFTDLSAARNIMSLFLNECDQ